MNTDALIVDQTVAYYLPWQMGLFFHLQHLFSYKYPSYRKKYEIW